MFVSQWKDVMPTQRELDAAVRAAQEGKKLTNAQQHGLQDAAKLAGPFGRQAERALEEASRRR